MEKIKIGSICCGMGGFDEGLSHINFETVWAVDIMPEACKSFKINHKNTLVICKDAHTITDFNKLGKIQGLVFGPPCQGFSRGNAKRSMQDPRNYVYKSTLKALEQTNAEFFIFENVIGLIDMKFSDGSSVFEKIKRDYEYCSMGYNINWQVIDCATVGVPQANRLRLIMVGIRKDINFKYQFDPLTHGKDKIPFVTQKQAIGHLININQKGLYYEGVYDWKFLSRKRQKNWNEPAYTVEASARYSKIHPGYGKMKWIRKNKWEIPKECRRLSVLENKILQTFPEEYKVYGSLEKQYEQIGNAVPPKLAEFIGKPIYRYYTYLNIKSIFLNIIPILQKKPYISGKKVYDFLKAAYSFIILSKKIPNINNVRLIEKCSKSIIFRKNI